MRKNYWWRALCAAVFVAGTLSLFFGVVSVTEAGDGESVRRIIVKFKKGVPMRLSSGARVLRAREEPQALLPCAEGDLCGLCVMKCEGVVSIDELIGELKRDPVVEYAELDYPISVAELRPNDPMLPDQWGLHNIGWNKGKRGADISAFKAWSLVHDSDAVVGVLDTGIDYTHLDLAANIWRNPGEISDDGIDNDGNGYVDDVYGWNFVDNNNQVMDLNGHGTHVAGIIGACGDNNIGIAGVCWRVRIVSLRILDEHGHGFMSDAIRAMHYAGKMRIPIINNSWTLLSHVGPRALRDALRWYGRLGYLTVAAAGNERGSNDPHRWWTSYPASYSLPGIVSVAASDEDDALANFSSWGKKSVDLAAPGVDILSTVTSVPWAEYYDPSGYKKISGTSMATPFVTGAAALLWSQLFSPDRHTNVRVKKIIMERVDRMPQLRKKVRSGGRLNLAKLFDAA